MPWGCARGISSTHQACVPASSCFSHPGSAEGASFIWIDDHGQGRNVLALFRRVVRLRRAPRTAVLHLFADTRYRLRVNGVVAGYGPARFLPSHPEYDSIDIAPHLRAGDNVIAVEVNSFGAASFETVPSFGGFIAWGEAGGASLATPGEWRVRRVDAWDASAPPWSFAQGPTEIADLRRLDPAWWTDPAWGEGWIAPVLHLRADNWGALAPRSQEMFGLRVLEPAASPNLFPLLDGEQRIGFRIETPFPAVRGERWRVVYASCVWSPRAQELEFSGFWGPHFLNGEPVEVVQRHTTGNRQTQRAAFREGWNLLYGEPELLQEHWGLLIGFPAEAGLVPRSSPRHEALGVLRHGVPMTQRDLDLHRTRTPAVFEDLPALPGGWHITTSARPPLPAREMGWDRFGAPAAGADVVPPGTGGGALVADFGQEFIGHVVLDIEGPAGTVVDVSVDDVLGSGGTIDIFRSQHHVNSAERVILPGGRVLFEFFHPRGGRFVQATVRDPSGPVRVHALRVRRTLVEFERVGRFRSGDDVLDWAWEAGAHTIEASVEDGFVDPWRERGAYVGDSLVEHLAMRALTAQDAVTRRLILLWARGQRADGQIHDVIPAWKPTYLADYTLIWILLARDFWAWTGDASLIREVWPHIRRVFASPAWVEAKSGLWVTDDQRVFVDWAVPPDARLGENGVLNAFRIAALEAAAEMAVVVRRRDEAAGWRREAARVRRAFQKLWDPAPGLYAAQRSAAGLATCPAIHANILALAYGIVPRAREASVLRHVRAVLARNHTLPEERVELYFLHFALLALADRGLAADCEAILRNHYAILRERGAWSLWECLERGLQNYGSLCHGWSCSPNVHLSLRVLGVEPEVPGRPDRVRVAPLCDSLDRAEGVVPHPRGPIEVAWEVKGDTLRLRVRTPRGVTARIAPRGRLAKLRLVRV